VRYFVTVNSGPGARREPYSVDVVRQPSGALEVRVDGLPIEVDAVPVGRHLSVRVRGLIVDLTTEGEPPEMTVLAGGSGFPIRVESERTRSTDRGTKAAAGHAEKVVKSPMPGRVVRVLVAKGDALQVGEGLVVLEAMKMENEVRTRAAGIVADVHVTAGDAVEAGAKLVTLA
jgi:glutaconyl-CoA/methylmalonyl-CoA decarboxylase subunit gamma